MSFQSLLFLLFLAVSVPVCRWVGRKDPAAGKTCLLVVSLLFYLKGVGFVELLLGVLVSTLAVRYLTSGKPEAGRKRVTLLACAYHIVVLAVFKYAHVGWMPLGLSFFTFQQLWLLKEAYTRQFRPDTTEDLLLHALFFPTVTSGPILRPGAFFPQLKEKSFLRPSEADTAAGLYAICLGMAKKVLLADQLGVMVASGWGSAPELTAPAAWATMAAYTLQLYLDFSGYCDIAAGCARLLGIRLPVNFDSPYRSLSVGEFWKRWHITLTTFLRECVYFPLGGSRRGTARTCLNIMTVFLISGLWHGTGWTFVVWGLLHGLAQVDERLWGDRLDRLPKVFRWALTMFFINFAWVFFHAPDLTSALTLLAAAVSGGGEVGLTNLAVGVFESEVNAVTTILPALAGPLAYLLPAALIAMGAMVALWPKNTIQKMEEFRPTVLSGATLAALALWSVLSFSGVTTFIYSNF